MTSVSSNPERAECSTWQSGLSAGGAHSRATAAFIKQFGCEPTVVSRAPGRVNLIGDHTDYNYGFVLPIALPFDTVIAARPNLDRRVEAHSEGFGSTTFEIGKDPSSTSGWGRYLHAMAVLLDSEGVSSPGWHACIASDIPAGAGLSTSAALEMAAGLVGAFLADAKMDTRRLARLGQHAENDYLGLPSGIMDQLASAASRAGHASLIDCRDLSTTFVPMPNDASVVVMDTGTRRNLTDSAFASRAESTLLACRRLGVESLRDISTVLDLKPIADDQRLLRRATHVVTENQRVLDVAHAMKVKDSVSLGRLMTSSHASLRDDYEVSSPALDRIVEVALEAPGCLGARMTGGGFAGCAVALVRSSSLKPFCEQVASNFVAPDRQRPVAPSRCYVVEASAGASVDAFN